MYLNIHIHNYHSHKCHTHMRTQIHSNTPTHARTHAGRRACYFLMSTAGASVWLQIFFGKLSYDMQTTFPAHLSCELRSMVRMLVVPTLARSSVSGTLPCHLIFSSVLRLSGSDSAYTVQCSHAYKSDRRMVAA